MTESDSLPTWPHGARNLHDFICKARHTQSDQVINLLLQHLQNNNLRFRALLDDTPKNADHRTQLQKGETYIQGTLYKVNDEFIQNAILLSDELDINEYEASTLLHFGMEEAARVDADLIRASVELYYSERGYLLASLNIILKSIADASVNGKVKRCLLECVEDIMTDKAISFGDNGTGTFTSKILQTTKKLNVMIKTLTKNGTLNTTTPSKPATAPQTQLSSTTPVNNTTTPTITPQLDSAITTMRIDKLTDERIYLMEILYHLASLYWLDGDDLIVIIGYVEKSNLSTLITPYLSMILLAAFSPRNGLKDGDDLALNTTLLKTCHDKIQHGQWKVPALRSMVTLQWISFLMGVIQRDPAAESRLPLNELQCKELANDAVSSANVFGFMNDYLLYFQRARSDDDENKNYVTEDNAMVLDGLTVDPGDYTKFIADIKPDFRIFVIYEIKDLTTFIIKHMTDVLSNLNYQEEDRVSQIETTVVAKKAAIVGPEHELYKKQDLELFFTLLANIYRYGRNEGIWFWDLNESTDNSFVKWVMENIKLVGTMQACFDFFGAISTGDQCALQSFRFFESGSTRPVIASSHLFSWGKLFAAIHFYVPLLRQATDKYPAVFPPGEEDLLKTFLYLLKQVVQYSGDARLTLWNDPVYRVRDSLTELANSAISSSLRASLCDVLAAFCSPWGGGINGIGRNISLQVWHIVEHGNVFIVKPALKRQQYEVNQATVSAKAKAATTSTADQLSGFLRELSLERETRSYVETLSMLNLLVNLIHTQTKRYELQSGFSPVVSSIPIDLGKETRFPGAQPYISLVIDNLLLTLDKQHYKNLDEKWQLTEMCLRILENSVFSFDLTQLLDAHASWQKSPSYKLDMEKALSYYITHPGFEVIIRILSGGSLVGELFKIVSNCQDAIVESKESSLCQAIPGSLVRCLRIIYRVLQLQDPFGNILLPDVVRSSTRLPSGKCRIADLTFTPWPSLAPVGNHMLCDKSVIIRLGKLINCGDYEEICYLSNKIIHQLSLEPSHTSGQYDVSRVNGIYGMYGGLGSQLTELFTMDNTSYDIVRGISERFEIEQPEETTCDDYDYDINNIPFWLATEILNNTFKYENDFYQQHMTTSVRLAVLDMLLDNAAEDRPSPCLTEFLLGIDGLTPSRNRTTGERSTAAHDLQARQAKLICLDVILNMLRANLDISSLPDQRGDQEVDDPFLPLTATHPILAEKCYQLIYRLCAKPSTSSKVMAYLRIRDDYFYNQLKSMLSTLSVYTAGNGDDSNPSVTPGAMVYHDGSKVVCDMINLRSELHQRAWRLKTIAIELHTFSGTKSKSDAIRLLDLLYGGEDTLEKRMRGTNGLDNNDDPTLWPTVIEEPFTSFMELPTTLGFTWLDDLTKDDDSTQPPTQGLKYFSHFDTKHHQTTSVTGCKVHDIKSIYAYLRRHQRNMQQAGTIIMDTDNWAVEEEMGTLLRRLMADNHSREIQCGQQHCFEAWQQVIQVTVLDNFEFLSRAKRDKIISVLLQKLLPMLINGTDNDFLLQLARTILLCVGRLHKDSKETIDSSPTDPPLALHRQLQGIFEIIIKVVQDSTMTRDVRRTMYASAIHLVRTLPNNKASTDIRQEMVKQLAQLRSSLADTLDPPVTPTNPPSRPSLV
ncbi:nucleoporin Nup186/Nup192/Nup205 [Chlamydoabsidia padenii]|nr:nucleoporin Nup186/Nup192/Nup205 [Chlamydoabsidia padenii]